MRPVDPSDRMTEAAINAMLRSDDQQRPRHVRSDMKTNTPKKKNGAAFNAQAFLDSAGVSRTIVEFQKKDTIFSQGDPCKTVMYIQKGSVKLSVVSQAGKEVVVAMLKPGDFVGEGGLAGQPLQIGR